MSADVEEPLPTMTHEEISRLGGLKSAQNLGPRKLKARAQKASAAGQESRARCKHPENRIVERNGARYCRYCGRKVSRA